jgi:hypothetical protein
VKARDIFGLIVRTSGLFVFLYSLWSVLSGVAYLLGAVQNTAYEKYMNAYFTFGIPGLIAGLVLLLFGRQIVRISYPKGKDDSEA